MIKQSKELTEFYRAYKAWLDSGAEDDCPFLRMYGLCWALDDWCIQNAVSPVTWRAVSRELEEQFTDAGLSRNYPFSDGPPAAGSYQYGRECDQQINHLNPKRIQWVKDHCND